jgi:hypothetical protein
MAMSSKKGEIEVAVISNEFGQTGNLDPAAAGGSTEKVRLHTIDDFAAENGIASIHVLKTDTEGHDLEVIVGAVRMMTESRIASLISEATIQPEDTEHTQLGQLQEILNSFGLQLRSILDLHHFGENGRLAYFNALFIKD